MNISGLRPFEALDHFKVDKDVIAKAQADRISRMALPEGRADSKTLSVNFNAEKQTPISQKMTAKDYAGKFKPVSVREMKGADSDINKLDKVPAYVSASKDSVLLQYQFYVGPKNSLDEKLQVEENTRQIENFDVL